MKERIFFLLLIITISILASFNLQHASAYQVSYPDNGYRASHPPTYCAIESSDEDVPDNLKADWMSIVNEAVLDWTTQLQNAEINNVQYWEMNYFQIPNGESYSDYDCDIPIFFKQHPDNPEKYYKVIGTFFSQPPHIELYYWHGSNCYDPAGSLDCYITGEFLPQDQMNWVARHEIGHSLALGHYTTDDNEVNEMWVTGDTIPPSIMTPIGYKIPSLHTITDVDIQRLRSIYGENGFYAFSPEGAPEIPTPQPTPTPTPTPLPILPVRPFDSLDITNNEIIISRYEKQIERIVGDISKDEFLQGHPVFILITKPDQTSETLRVIPTSKGHFEVVIVFDRDSPIGYYSVEASYLEHTDREMDVTFRVTDKNTPEESVPNITGKEIPFANTQTEPDSDTPKANELKEDKWANDEKIAEETSQYFQQGYDLLNEGRYQEAIPLFEKFLEDNPNDVNSLNNLGYASNQLGKYEDTAFYADKILEIDPENTVALNNKGYALDQLGRYEEAVSYFDKTLQIDPKNNYALFQEGYTLTQLGRYDDAISYYDKILQINPKNIDALNNIGYAFNQLGRYEEAIPYFDKALSIEPNYAVAQENKKFAQDKLEAEKGGGCLIATAAFGSELAPQVQQLRELREKILLNTQSGSTFMTLFNQFYYSFSPTIADWERQNPVFREAVKISITPLITTLSILNYANIDSEDEMLGYGISLILLNVGMYFVLPVSVIIKLRCSKKHSLVG